MSYINSPHSCIRPINQQIYQSTQQDCTICACYPMYISTVYVTQRICYPMHICYPTHIHVTQCICYVTQCICYPTYMSPNIYTYVTQCISMLPNTYELLPTVLAFSNIYVGEHLVYTLGTCSPTHMGCVGEHPDCSPTHIFIFPNAYPQRI